MGVGEGARQRSGKKAVPGADASCLDGVNSDARVFALSHDWL